MNPQLAEFVALMRRYPWCVMCIVVTLVCGGAAVYVHYFDLAALAEPYAQRDKEYKEMLDLTKGGLTQRQELEHVTQVTQRIEDNLLIGDDLAGNNWYFYKFEEQTRAHLGELHQLNSPATDNSPMFRRVPYSLRVLGTFEQVAAFIQALERGPRLMRVTTFSMSRSAAGSKEGGRGVVTETVVDPGVSNVVADLNIELLGKK
ncbi:MAG: type 4a pilus biogenesis protein PilO [Verrucomicrobia bacterium]|nr:type 4a pilus biogenesis protein PilO [Verrucomicrobiota bacterium]